MVPVAGEDQHGRDDVVREHLPVVLPPGLDIDDHDLLEPECVLYQRVPLSQPLDFPIGPVRPEFFEVEHVVRVHQQVLRLLAAAWEERTLG